VTGAGEADREVLAGTAPAQSAPGQQQPANGGALPPPPMLKAGDQKRLLKAQKKAEKEKHRAEKKVCTYIMQPSPCPGFPCIIKIAPFCTVEPVYI